MFAIGFKNLGLNTVKYKSLSLIFTQKIRMIFVISPKLGCVKENEIVKS